MDICSVSGSSTGTDSILGKHTRRCINTARRFGIPQYRSFNDYLQATLGLPFDALLALYPNIYQGTSWPGIYADTAVLLEKLVGRSDVESVVEFGSGASTVYINLAARLHGKFAVSFEEEDDWREKTNALLAAAGLQPTVRRYDPHHVPQNADVVFHDSLGHTRTTLPYAHLELFSSCRYLLVDDMEDADLSAPILKLLSELGRPDYFFFNPTERKNRNILVNARETDLRPWIEPWLADVRR